MVESSAKRRRLSSDRSSNKRKKTEHVEPLAKMKPEALVNVNIEEEKERKANGEAEPDKSAAVEGSQDVIIQFKNNEGDEVGV